MEDAIANWWKDFQREATRIDALFQGKEEWDLPQFMEDHLNAISPDLMWEFGPAINESGHRLVITAELNRPLRPLVREILRHAPRMPGWEFYPYRLAENMENAVASVEARGGGDLRPLYVTAEKGDFNEVELMFYGFPREVDEQHALATMMLGSEALLGEEVLDRWIGVIDRGSAKPPAGAFPVSELPARVTALVAQIFESLPSKPWYEVDFEKDGVFSIFELNDESDDQEEDDEFDRDEEEGENQDFARQDDLIVGMTAIPAMLEHTRHGLPFDSIRYSRCGEKFCYLKIDCCEMPIDVRVEIRQGIDESINSVLRPVRLGSTIGGGTGRRYIYIELALTDVEAAWREIRMVLQDRHLPQRTWLLFHDSESCFEWRGLYDDSPEPLLVDTLADHNEPEDEYE